MGAQREEGLLGLFGGLVRASRVVRRVTRGHAAQPVSGRHRIVSALGGSSGVVGRVVLGHPVQHVTGRLREIQATHRVLEAEPDRSREAGSLCRVGVGEQVALHRVDPEIDGVHVQGRRAVRPGRVGHHLAARQLGEDGVGVLRQPDGTAELVHGVVERAAWEIVVDRESAVGQDELAVLVVSVKEEADLGGATVALRVALIADQQVEHVLAAGHEVWLLPPPRVVNAGSGRGASFGLRGFGARSRRALGHLASGPRTSIPSAPARARRDVAPELRARGRARARRDRARRAPRRGLRRAVRLVPAGRRRRSGWSQPYAVPSLR